MGPCPSRDGSGAGGKGGAGGAGGAGGHALGPFKVICLGRGGMGHEERRGAGWAEQAEGAQAKRKAGRRSHGAMEVQGMGHGGRRHEPMEPWVQR